MKIYTKTGDKGKTALFGGERVDKDHLRLKAYGGVDELNSALGLLRSYSFDVGLDLVLIQKELFIIGSELATPPSGKASLSKRMTGISAEPSIRLETWIDQLEKDLPALKTFILPDGTPEACQAHSCRCLCRRVERDVISLHKVDQVRAEILVYLNRLSDFLFVLARKLNHLKKVTETPWP